MLRFFTICNTKPNPSKKFQRYHRKWRLSIVMGFQNANENKFYDFGNLVIWLWKSFGKVVEIFLKEFVRSLHLIVFKLQNDE